MKYLIGFICFSLVISASISQNSASEEFETVCANPEDPKCAKFMIRAAIDFISSKSSENLLDSSSEDFLYGFYMGIQKNPLYPSFCVQSFTPLSVSYSALITGFESIFTTMDLNYLFVSITNFNDYSNKLVSSWDLCGGNNLVTILESLGTANGIGNAIVNIGNNYSQIMTNLQLMSTSIENKEYINAGVAFGQIVSGLLEFSI
ncbi:unnamed protein product [Blepharisma stoltei]|uniref:Uncharacterized protein n=1 Tax=Blepharisma stoltei TaxID=1481888 RepID=A0AAU9JCF1_9CILI|nr:unnamed protein product [Blepharisma stoltei]